ncbi:MAG: PAS domain S-box protein [Methanobacteriota archaeon]
MNYHDAKISGMAFRCRADAALGFEYVDEGSIRVTGYNEAELVQTGLINLPDLIHPAGREEVRRLIQDSITRRGSFAVPFEILTKDRIPVEGILIGRGIFADPLNLTAIEGYLLRMQTSGVDASDAINQFPDDLWQRMLDHTGDIVAFIGWDGTVRYITPSVMRILGYRKDLVTGSAFSTLLMPGERNRFEDVRQRIHTMGGGGSSARFLGMHVSGAKMQILIRFFAFSGSDGSVILTASPADDEKTLAEPTYDLFQVACATSPVPLIITSKGDRRILKVNEVFLKLIGRGDAEEVTGLSLSAVGLQTSLNDIIAIEQVLEHSGVYEGRETDILTPVGNISILLSARLFEVSGQQGITWSLVPLPARTHDLESQKTEARPEIIRDLFSRFRNDLQTLENVMKIKGMQAQGEAKAAYREERAFISAVSSFYQKITAVSGSDKVPVCAYLNVIQATIIEEYADNLGQVTFSLSCDGDWGLGISAGIPIGIIATELLINSTTHAFSPGESGRIDLSFSKEEDLFILQIRDSGKGLPEEVTRGQAASAGLAMVENLAMQISGTASFSNDGGAQVRIIFPDSEL